MRLLMLYPVLAGLVGTSNPALAADSALDRKSLQGVKQFYVIVEELESAATDDGLTKDQIKVDVELRLRKAGIQLTEDHAAGGFRYLYIQASLIKGTEALAGLYAYNVRVEFVQPAVVESNWAEVQASTWSVGNSGMVGRKNVARGTRDTIGDLVDTFLNAYLSVNPPKP